MSHLIRTFQLQDIEPKCEMNIESVNATLIGKQKLGKPYGLQLLVDDQEGKTRNFYMYSETGKVYKR